MATKKLINQIVDECWEQFEALRDPGNPGSTYVYPKQKEISCYKFWGDDSKEITETEAKELLRTQAKAQLNQLGKVYLYTCRDNYLIAIEEFSEEDADQADDEDLYEKQGDLPLYIGFD